MSYSLIQMARIGDSQVVTGMLPISICHNGIVHDHWPWY